MKHETQKGKRFQVQRSFLKLVTVVILTVWQNAVAEPIDRFPGLSELIKKADVVAIVDVWEKAEKGTGSSYLTQYSTIVHCLKGDIPDWTEMRLGFRNTPINMLEIPRELQEYFIPPSRYVVFLGKIKNRSDDGPPQYKPLSTEGAILEISRLSHLSDFKGKPPEEAIIGLLQDVVRIRKEQLKILEKQLSSVLDMQGKHTPNTERKARVATGGGEK